MRALPLISLLTLATACSSGTTPTPSPAPDAATTEDASTADAGEPDASEADAGPSPRAPEARASADPLSGELPLLVTLDASSSSDPDGDALTYRWVIADGTTLEGVTVTHTFTRPGTTGVTLTVTDATGLSSEAALQVRGVLPECPTFAAGLARGTVSSPILDEVSGLVASRRTPDLLWLNNDSGDGPRIYATDGRGNLRAGYELSGAQAVDWEDIALGPGPEPDTDYLYVGDIGDNALASDIAPIYRIVEPANVPAPAAQPPLVRVRSVDTIVLSYGGGRAFNAETMMVDPRNGDLYVVTKSDTGRSVVFRAAAPLAAGARVQMEELLTIDVRGEATGGDISPQGEIVIRTYQSAFLWRRPVGTRVEDALAQTPCVVRLQGEQQGEAISFAADGRELLTTSEGTSQRIYVYTRR